MLSRWVLRADESLAPLFVAGEPAPTRAQLIAAYPFGERNCWPYKVWLRRVKAWRVGHALGLAGPYEPMTRRHREHDGATLDLFESVAA